MFEIGEFLMQGLTNGISENTEQGIDAASTMAHDTVDALAKGFGNTKDIWNDAFGGDMNPTIKPVLDLSQVEEQASKIQELLPQDDIRENLSANMTTQLAGRAVQGTQSRVGETVNETVNNGSNVVFNQYNTSPKALSETEIYRQTHNQIEQFRGAMYDL